MNCLKAARLAAGYSLEVAAKKLGISAGYLSQIENGARKVSFVRARTIADLYEMEIDDIFLAERFAVREVVEL